MAVTSSGSSNMILTVESIPKYLKEHWEDTGLSFSLSRRIKTYPEVEGETDIEETQLYLAGEVEAALNEEDGIQVTTIQGGNVNYAFRINFPSMGEDEENGKTVFLKQAPEFVAIFGPDGFPLTSERMQRELDVYSEYKTILGDTLSKKYLPDIYYFDKKHMIVIMEFLDGHDLLDHALVSKNLSSCSDNDDDDDHNEKTIAENLGDFMGRVHSATHSSNVSKERCDYLTKHFENREMRNVQLEFVFTKCYKEATNEQRSGLTLTSEFMKEIELLKKQYNGNGGGGHVLCHGDLHPGSVMVNTWNGSTKVIDPEFTVYGPAGLDVGSLLHGYCLGAIHQAYSNNPDAVKRIISSAETLWCSYKKSLMNKYNDGNDISNSSSTGGISVDTMKAIEIETVGFTVAEVCRTSLGFAGGRLWLQFDDVETKAASTKAALQLVDKCMIARHDGGIDLLFNELKKICNYSVGSELNPIKL